MTKRSPIYRSLLLTGLLGVVWIGLQPIQAWGWQLQQAPIMTPWADLVNTNAPWPEYPRPQLVRGDWMNLNGIWEFQPGSGSDPVPTNSPLSDEILVPFPMESALSGVMDHHPHSWYRRTFTVPAGWSGQQILLHLDAVDWESEVFINGQTLGIHKGGYDRITRDITAQLAGSGPQELIVRVYDPTDNYGQPRGKQTLYPGGIMYTSCSGIWQSVWLEPVSATRVASLKLIPDIDNDRLGVTVNVAGPSGGVTVNAVALNGTNVVGAISGAPGATLQLPVPDPILWSPTNAFLYDLTITLSNGPVQLDAVSSYFGMRKISLGTHDGFVKMLLNDEFVFQYGPLDQGFWPDGIYTAPTDDALKSDIEQTKLLGFNMIRKHIKVEPARWYYWADKLGILVWQDMPSLNSYTGNPQPIDAPQYQTELTRMVEGLWNHPSIISWVVFNEFQGIHDTEALVQLVQTLDPSRLVNHNSGASHDAPGPGDIFDVHSYPNPSYPVSSTQAVVCGEFGGLGLQITNHIWAPGWGYGGLLNNAEELMSGFETFCFQLSDYVENHGLSAAVYTEITDVEIELNGFLSYDREVRKPDPDRIREAIALVSTPIVLTPVVPTSESSGQSWRYTTSTPPGDWMESGFNDSGWSTGDGGFGGNNPPNTAGLIRTLWSSSDIWLRRSFDPGTLTPQQLSNLVFRVYHDEDVEIYINGVLAASASGYTVNYIPLEMTPAGQAAIIPNGTHILAVHCQQTGGGQYIDVGISVQESSVTVPPRPMPSAPTGLQGAAGQSAISLSWNASLEATLYNVKRATSSGGPYTNLVTTAPINAFTDTDVSNGVTYYYVVSAENASGVSGNSSEVGVTAVIPPPPTPQVVAWFRADSISGLSNGDPVDIWEDASANGLDATQVVSSQRPTFVVGAINGLPVVQFDATDETFLEFDPPVQDDFTIFCVFQSAQGVGTGVEFYQGAGLVNGEVPFVVNDYGMSLNANGEILAGTGNPDTSLVSDPGFNDGEAHVVAFRRDRSTGTIQLWVDGVLEASATGGLQSLTDPPRLVMGAQQTEVAGDYLTGGIAEVKIYDAALTASDRAAEENALFCKYGLGPGALPGTPLDFSGVPGNREILLNWAPTVGSTGYKLNWSLSAGGPFTQISGNLASTEYVDTSAVSGGTNYYKLASFSPCGVSMYSDALAVFLPLPALGITAGGGVLTLRWPDWAEDWVLSSTTHLSPPVTWSPLTNVPATTNNEFILTLPMGAEQEYFRLSSS